MSYWSHSIFSDIMRYLRCHHFKIYIYEITTLTVIEHKKDSILLRCQLQHGASMNSCLLYRHIYAILLIDCQCYTILAFS